MKHQCALPRDHDGGGRIVGTLLQRRKLSIMVGSETAAAQNKSSAVKITHDKVGAHGIDNTITAERLEQLHDVRKI